MLRVLVVEDSPQHRKRVVDVLTKQLSGYEVLTSDNREDALTSLAVGEPDLVILDLVIPAAEGSTDLSVDHGEAVLRAVKDNHPHIKVIILSAEGDLVRDFLRDKGADDFFTKGQREAWEQEKLPSQVERMIGHLVCRSEAMQAVREDAAALQRSTSLVAIEGTLGSGKQYLASVLHRCSPRALRRFQPLDVLTLSPDNALAELVGRRGEAHQRGLLEAGNGCLYLHGVEKIGDLGPGVQRQLASGPKGAGEGMVRYRPLDSPEWQEADTLVAVGSSRPFAELAEAGEMVEDLFRALTGGAVLHMPALRERLADVPELLGMLRRRACDRQGKHVRRIAPGVAELVVELLSDAPPADGWDGIAALVDGAVESCTGDALGPEHFAAAELPERYEFVWVREWQVQRRRGSEADLAAMEAEGWPLVMYSRHDGTGRSVSRFRGSAEGEVEDERLGRILHLLADRAGDVVELARHKRELGLDPSAQIKRFIMLLRRMLDDTDVADRRSRFFASHYSEAYEFLTDTDFLLVYELPVDA